MKDTRHLITQAQKGNQLALNQLFSDWYHRVYNIAYRYFSDAQLAKEICQQTFMIVQEKLEQLRDPSTFKVWLYRIATNQCHAENRKKKTRMNHEEKHHLLNTNAFQEAPDQIFEKEERAQMVLNALQQLPKEQRTVLIMKEYEGLKFREIAEVLGISENTAKSRLYYGLKALRTSFSYRF